MGCCRRKCMSNHQQLLRFVLAQGQLFLCRHLVHSSDLSKLATGGLGLGVRKPLLYIYWVVTSWSGSMNLEASYGSTFAYDGYEWKSQSYWIDSSFSRTETWSSGILALKPVGGKAMTIKCVQLLHMKKGTWPSVLKSTPPPPRVRCGSKVGIQD